MARFLWLYHALPYPLKCVMASIKGYNLEKWRYGSDTDRLVKEALERDYWEKERLRLYQEERIAKTLKNAIKHVPYYKRNFQEKPSITGKNIELKDFGILDKESLRADPMRFISENYSCRSLYHLHTSGSTGTPLSLYLSREAVLEWYSVFEARWRIWNGINRNDRWAIIGGQQVARIDRKTPPFWVWNSPMKQLYISAYHIASWSVESMIKAMKEYKVVYLWGYASAIEILAKEMRRLGIDPPPIKKIISNAEPLLGSQRETIKSVFHAPVISTYGMSESVIGASECSEGRMHLWEDIGYAEIVGDDGENIPTGETGRMICTGLINDAMPLIRYETGDRASIAPDSPEPCPCGRKLKTISCVEGRSDDVVETPDGRKIGRLDTVFKADYPIRRAQIIQEDINSLRVLIEPADEYDNGTDEMITASIMARVGPDMKIYLEKVPSIPLSANGKFRGVVNLINR